MEIEKRPKRAVFNVWLDVDMVENISNIAKKEEVTSAEVTRQLLKSAIQKYLKSNKNQ